MKLHEIINVLNARFANRVEFLRVDQIGLDVRVGPREYAIYVMDDRFGFFDVDEIIEGDTTASTQHSQWLRGVLLGKVRDAAGYLVDAA